MPDQATKKFKSAFDRLLRTIVSALHPIIEGKRWLFTVTAAAVLLAILIRFPLYETLPLLSTDVENQATLLQVNHPFRPLPSYLKDIGKYGGRASHIDKMELRLTIPVLGHLSGTGRWTVPVWSAIAAVFLFFLIALRAGDMAGKTAASLFLLGLAPTFFGTWGFNDFVYGDAVGLTLMLLTASLAGHPWLAAVSFLGAAFCDERCVIAAPVLLLYFFLRYSRPEEAARRIRSMAAVVIAIAAWIALRVWLTDQFHLTMGRSELGTISILWGNLRDHLTSSQTLFSFVGMYRATWILPVLALRRLILKKAWMTAAWMTGAFGLAVISAFLVVDLNRSICYVYIIFLVSLDILWRDSEAPATQLAAIMLVNILISPPGKTVLRLLPAFFAR